MTTHRLEPFIVFVSGPHEPAVRLPSTSSTKPTPLMKSTPYFKATAPPIERLWIG